MQKLVKVTYVKASVDPAIKVLSLLQPIRLRLEALNLIGYSALRSLLPSQFPNELHNQTPKRFWNRLGNGSVALYLLLSVNHINPDDPVNSHIDLGFWPQAFKNFCYK